MPGLPENVRVLIAGSDGPAAWRRDLGELLRVVRLGNLTDEAALELLERNGVARATAARVAPLTQGHPLSLQLAAGALAERPTLAAEDAVVGSMVEELAGLYVDGLDPITRRALDAASVVRRTTLSLLQAMLPDEDPADLFARLRALPFVELGARGPARPRCRPRGDEGAAARRRPRPAPRAPQRGVDPAARRAAHGRRVGPVALHRGHALPRGEPDRPVRVLPERLRRPGDRARAPRRREAIAPAGIGPVPRGVVAPGARDVPRRARRRRRGARLLEPVPAAGRPARVAARRPSRAAPSWSTCAETPCRPGSASCSTDGPAAPTAGATAALWLDAKRAYLELRPHLRRLYVPAPDADAALAALAPLGFVRLDVGVESFLLNDFGPGSIDAWLGDVVGRELQAETSTILDVENRQLVLDGQSVDLSRLELDVLRHLQRREGIAVTREELLREVWGHEWTGGSSNVVEVVVSGLRRKLGDRAAALQTVRGVGYRLASLD